MILTAVFAVGRLRHLPVPGNRVASTSFTISHIHSPVLAVDRPNGLCDPTSDADYATSDKSPSTPIRHHRPTDMAFIFSNLLSWLRTLFFAKHLEITIVGLQASGKTS